MRASDSCQGFNILNNCFQMYEIGAIDGERREKCETGL